MLYYFQEMKKNPRIRSSNAGKSHVKSSFMITTCPWVVLIHPTSSSACTAASSSPPLVENPALPPDGIDVAVWDAYLPFKEVLPAPSSPWTRKEAAVQSSSSSWVILMTMGSTYTKHTWSSSSPWLYVYLTAGIFCWKEKLLCALSHQ